MTQPTIFCKKLGKEAEALDQAPFPNELGQRIYENISKQAWQAWLNHQTMLINEYRLSLIEQSARKFLQEEMEKFLFSDCSQKPSGYVEIAE
jgi:Fe-S cluster biosynthesis and repair protein YggX